MESISNCQVLVLQIADRLYQFSEIAGPDRDDTMMHHALFAMLASIIFNDS
jgi:hypothetical protein